ncbi:MAG: hypothetical protein ACJ72Z_12240 [Pyrinomonadaceae bacterium]
MPRLSLMLIAAIAAASFFTQPSVGQFTNPKIRVPKVPTKDAPATPNKPDQVGTASSSSSQASNGTVRGIPIPGSKITFSNNPDGSNPKTSFTSSEYIYGRLDLGGRTMYDAFGFKALGDAKFYYINYDIQIVKPGEKVWDGAWSGKNYTMVTKEDAQKTYWNFDVLPDPSKITTVGSAIADELQYYNGGHSLYSKWYNADSARSAFPQSGNYTIDITLHGDVFDDWGKPTGGRETAPTASAAFAFQFSGSDGQRLVANSEKAKESFEAAKNRKEMLHTMPDWWAKAWTPTDPKLAPARLVPMIKGFISQWNLTYTKHMIVQFTGPLWVIEKNSVGIPEYRMAKPYIYIMYKEPKDNSCQVGALYMRENYAGGGTYGEPYLGGIRDVQYIDCAAVK